MLSELDKGEEPISFDAHEVSPVGIGRGFITIAFFLVSRTERQGSPTDCRSPAVVKCSGVLGGRIMVSEHDRLHRSDLKGCEPRGELFVVLLRWSDDTHLAGFSRVDKRVANLA